VCTYKTTAFCITQAQTKEQNATGYVFESCDTNAFADNTCKQAISVTGQENPNSIYKKCYPKGGQFCLTTTQVGYFKDLYGYINKCEGNVFEDKMSCHCSLGEKYGDCALKEKENVKTQEAQNNSEPTQLSSLITKCGSDKLSDDCKDVSVFIEVLLQVVSYLFGIIGAIALGVFVYGGFVLILSQGNPEKVKQGTGAMINAVIGLVIAFGGYVLVSFLSEAIGVKAEFILK
jgi:hypothetical protein